MGNLEVIEPGRIYESSDTAKILEIPESSLSSAVRRGAIKSVDLEGKRGFIGDEIKRYDGRPKEEQWHRYYDMLHYIPDLTKEEFDNWVLRMLNEDRYPYDIRNSEGEGTMLKLRPAQRLYNDMTLKKT